MKTSKELFAEAQELRQKADEIAAQAVETKRQELLALPLKERLVYAASARCDCGLGMAYDPAHPDGPCGSWRCSGVILHASNLAPEGFKLEPIHSPPMPFAFYEVKSENTNSANGATTRPKE